MLRGMHFHGPEPSPIPGAHMFTVSFHDDASIHFGAGTDSPAALAAHLRRLLEHFRECPELVDAACGVEGAGRRVFGEWWWSAKDSAS